jgi:hypothetical protein
MFKSGDRHWRTARQLLRMAARYMDIRIQRLAIIAGRLSDNKLKQLEKEVRGRNADLMRRMNDIEGSMRRGHDADASNHILGARNLNVIKGEPDLRYLFGILTKALESGDRALYIDQARAVINESSLLFNAWLGHVRQVVKAELIESAGADRAKVFRNIFQQFTQQLEQQFDRGLTTRGRAIYWARLYQAIYIPLLIDGTKQDERVPNPAFQAATFFQEILMKYTLKDLLDWRLMSENTRVNTVAFLRQIRGTHLTREHMDGLVAPIALDFNLNGEQIDLLKGSVYFEPRVAPLTFSETYRFGHKLYRFLRIVTLGRFKTSEESIDRWIELYVSPLVEARKFEKLSVEQLMLLHGHSMQDISISRIAEQRLAGILMIKQEIEDGYRVGGILGPITARIYNILAHNRYNLYNREAVLTIMKKSAKITEEDTEKKREKTIIALIILFLLLGLLMLYFLIIFKRSLNPGGLICQLPVLVTPWPTGMSGNIAKKGPRIIQHWRCRSYRPALFMPVSKIYSGWPYELLNNTRTVYPVVPINPFYAYYSATIQAFLNTILSTLIFYNWIYFRLLYVTIREIFVTVLKVVITVSERQIVLDAATSMGTEPGSRGYWTGFFNLIPRFINIFTCNISYTSTTYEYTMIV